MEDGPLQIQLQAGAVLVHTVLTRWRFAYDLAASCSSEGFPGRRQSTICEVSVREIKPLEPPPAYSLYQDVGFLALMPLLAVRCAVLA
eukprot:215697-Rhodomonas_salina.1